jgi:clan AA aspartic protease
MMRGIVIHRQPILRLTVRGPSGQETEIDTTVDTGFTGFLTLSSSQITLLGLPFVSYYIAALADGSRIRLSVYEVTVLWLGTERTVFVLETGGDPLLGMSLMEGSDFRMQAVDGGLLTFDVLHGDSP